MATSKQLTLDDARLARHAAAAWIVYAYVRTGEIPDTGPCSVQRPCTCAGCEAWRALVAMDEESFGAERGRMEAQLGRHAASSGHRSTTEAIVGGLMGGGA